MKKLQNASQFAGKTINAESGIVENPVVHGLARGIVALGNFVKRHAAMLLVAFIAMFGMSAFAQSTDATTIATDAQTAKWQPPFAKGTMVYCLVRSAEENSGVQVVSGKMFAC